MPQQGKILGPKLFSQVEGRPTNPTQRKQNGASTDNGDRRSTKGGKHATKSNRRYGKRDKPVSLNKEIFRLRNRKNGLQTAERRLKAGIDYLLKEQDRAIFCLAEDFPSSNQTEFLGQLPDEVSFNSVIISHAKNARRDGMAPQKAEQLLRRMQELSTTFPHLKPSIFTYNAVMEAYSKSMGSPNRRRRQQGQLSILRLFKELKETLEPNTYTFNLVLSSNSDFSEEWKKLEMWAMDFVGGKPNPIAMEPDRQTYNQLLKYYGEVGEARKAEVLLERIIRTVKADASPISSTLEPGLVWFNMLFKALSKTKDTTKDPGETAEKWLKLMEKIADMGLIKSRPDVSTYNHVLNVHAMSGNAERAESLVTELEEAFRSDTEGDKNLKPDLITYTTLIKTYAAEQRGVKNAKASLMIATEATRVFQKMQGLAEDGWTNISPSAKTCT